MYQDLVRQYENLSDEEKNTLLIYKSKLGIAINSLGNDENKVNEIYYKYKDILNNPVNLFMKMTVFKDISFDNEISFRESLEEIKEKLKSILTKLSLKENLTVYRIISVNKNNKVDFISRSDFISTSININTCYQFLVNDDDYEHYLYQINLEEGSLVAICPYAILYNYITNQLVLTKRTDQEEIIIDKNNYTFKDYETTSIKLNDNKNLSIIPLDAKLKEKIKTNTI